MGIRELFKEMGWLFRSVFSMVFVFFLLPALFIGWVMFAMSLNTPSFPWAAIVGPLPFFLLLALYYIEEWRINKILERSSKKQTNKYVIIK